MKNITASQLEILKSGESVYSGLYWFRSGSYGMSVFKLVGGQYVEAGHCNGFRNKTLKEINEEIFN